MPTREVRFELLLGKPVVNAAGRTVAHIEGAEVVADGEEYVVRAYETGPTGYVERLAGVVDDIPLLRVLPVIGRRIRRRPIPWQWIDLSDPERPRLVR